MTGEAVLVTGASGFIGAHLCARLVESGFAVHGVSREREGEADGLRWWRGDLADGRTVQRIVADIEPDVVFHLASNVHGAREVEHVLPMLHGNLMSTVNLLDALSRSGCRRVIITGSQEEPTEPGGVPSSPYAAAKWASSAYARMFHGLYELPVVLLRVFMVYGPGQRDVNKLIPYTIRTLLAHEAPRLSSGERPVDWIYVDDVVDAYLAALRREGIEGRTIDVGSGQLVPVRTIVEKLVQLIDPGIEPLFGALPERAMEQVRVADVDRARALLDWHAGTSLDSGLEQTVAYYAGRV